MTIVFSASNDGGMYFLECFGIVVVAVVLLIARVLSPRAARWPRWVPALIGFLAPPTGLVIYMLFPRG